MKADVKAVAVIPARYASTRFPGKPLARETGKYLIQHVYEQVQRAKSICEVMVATDDKRIVDAVQSFGGKAVMTRPDHPSGTDRIAEAIEKMACDVVVNVQGDEPEIEPESITRLLDVLHDHPECPMATLACPFKLIAGADPEDPNTVKVQIDEASMAVAFSRKNICTKAPHPLLHLGIYAYRRDFLFTFTKLKPTPLEKAERLEQMRAIENGYKIAVGLVERAAVGIDTPEDYAAFVKRWHSSTREES